MAKAPKQTVGEIFREVAKSVGYSIGNEARYAVDDIRQKVVEKPWFEKAVTPEHSKITGQDNPTMSPSSQEVSRDDLYGPAPETLYYAEPERADWDNVRAAAQDVAQGNKNDQELASDQKWESHKELAERLYGRDVEQPEQTHTPTIEMEH